MKDFIIYNYAGNILRTGSCGDSDLGLQKQENEFVMEGKANDVTQKIEGRGIGPHREWGLERHVVDKSPEEIEAEKPPEMPESKRPAHITKGQLQSILQRLDNLEAKGE